MKRLRQIVTRAVVAKGKKRSETTERLKPPNTPSSILGCWVINHHYTAKKHGKFVEVQGKFDINVWYSYLNHSKTGVHTETVHYKDKVRLHYRDGETSDANEVMTKMLQQPNCIEAIILPNGEVFEITVEREILVEVVGETTVCISVHPNDYEEEWNFDESSSSSSSSSSDEKHAAVESSSHFDSSSFSPK